MIYGDFIVETLTMVSEIAEESFGKVSGEVKSGNNNQVLTETDLRVGKLIIDRIKQTFPVYNIIDEESGIVNNESPFTWVVDPIDGTSNFAAGIPLYGIMIGLLNDGKPIAGGIALPSFEEIFVAVQGGGAYCNLQRISVSDETSLSNSLVAYGIDGHQENPQLTHSEMPTLGDIVLHIRNLRTSNSAFDYAMTARGSYGAILNRTSKIWDCVAPHILITEAGGKFTDFFGNPMDYSNPLSKVNNNFTWCGGAPVLHDQLQSIIHNLPTAQPTA